MPGEACAQIRRDGADGSNMEVVARKRSWNRDRKFGYDVVAVRTDAKGANARVTPFVTAS